MIHKVAVLGGGLAGAAAALRLAQGGAQPIWIAPEQNPGFKPGEHLSAAAVPLLKQLGSDALLRAEVHRHAHSTYSAWGSELLAERNAIVQLDGPPVVLDRNAFEDAVSAQAIAAGAVRFEQAVDGFQIVDRTWHLQTESETLKSQFVFDATGRKAIVASKLSARFQADKLCCQYALFETEAAAEPRPVTVIEAEEHGWWYLSVLADRRVVVNFFTDADLGVLESDEFEAHALKTNSVSTYLKDYGYRLSGRVKRLTTNSSWIAPAIGPGWVAIGDASAAFDPLSSHGMTTALWSAIQASDAYLQSDREKMSGYADSVAKGVQDYLTARTRMYAQEKRWRNSPFWARRHTSA